MKPFTKAQFRSLLIVYCLLLVFALIAESVKNTIIPEVVMRMERASLREWLAGFDKPAQISVLTVCVADLLANFVGLAGMFLLWRPGRFIFLGAVCVRMVSCLFFYTWQTETTWEMLFAELGLVMEGIIIASVFFGAAKDLFASESWAAEGH